MSGFPIAQRTLLIDDDVVVQVFPLDKPALTIGRSLKCDICLDDISVSSIHALIRITPNALLDGHNDVFNHGLQSESGVLVNDLRIKRFHLDPNDVVAIGSNRFKFLDEQIQGRETTALMLLD